MLKGFLPRPSIRLAGRRHSCSRPRSRGRAAALTAPPSGSSSSALRDSQHASDGVARLGSFPCAVMSCAPSAVDRQGNEHALHGVGNSDSSSSSSSSSSDFHVWRFKVATFEEGQHLHGGVRTDTSPATSHDATATTAGCEAPATATNATATTGTATTSMDAFSGVSVDGIAGSSSGSGSSRTPPLQPQERDLRDRGGGGYSQEEPRKDNGSSSVGTRVRYVATSEHPAGSGDSQRLASPEVVTYDSCDADEIPRSETNYTASSSSSSSTTTNNVTSGSSGSRSGGRQRKRPLRLPAERHWQQHSGRNGNPEAVRQGGRHPEARPMGRHRQRNDDGNNGDDEGGERLGVGSAGNRHARTALGSSSSSCISSSASPSASPGTFRSRDRTGVADASANGDMDECMDLTGASVGQSVGRRSRRGGRSLHTVPSWLEARRINQAIIEAGAWRQQRKILQLVEWHVQDFDRINTATALHRLGSCGLQPGGWEAKRVLTDPRFSQLLETLAEDHLTSLTAREVSNCLWALAKLGYCPAGGHSDAVADAGSANSHSGSSCGGRSGDSGSSSNRDGGITSNCGSSSSGGVVLEGLCAQLEALLGGLGPQEVANSLWALGNLGHHPGEHLLRGLTNRMGEVLPRAQPQEVSSALLGLAKLGWNPGPGVLDRVAHGSLTQIRKFNAQELSNTLWSLARLGHYNAHLQAAIFQQALRRASDFKPQELSSLALAAATMGLGPRADEVGDRTREGDGYWRGGGGASSRVGGRAGGRGIPHHQYFHKGLMPELLLRKLCDQAAATVQRYGHRELSNLLWATAKMGYRHKALLTAAADQAARQLAAGRGLGADGGEEEEQEEAEHRAGGSGGQRLADSIGGGGGDADNDIGGVHAGMRVTTTTGVSSAGGESRFCWSGRSVHSALWSYAVLRCHPGDEFIGQVCRHLASERHLAGLSVRDLLQCVWALATFQQLKCADAEGSVAAAERRKHRSQCCTAALAAVEREVVVRLKAGRARLVDETREAEVEAETEVDVAARFKSSSGGSNGSNGSGSSGSMHVQARMEGPEGGEGQEKPSSRIPRELLRPQHVSNLLWSYATLEHPAPDLFATLLPLLEHHLPLFSEQEISNSVWATARLQVYDEKVMDAVADHICSHRLPYLKPQDLASLAWAYGELGHAHKTLFDGLVSYTVSYVWPRAEKSMTLREIAAVCAAAGVFGWRYPVLVDAAVRVLDRLLIPMGQWGHRRDKHGTAFTRNRHSRFQSASAIPPPGPASNGLCSTGVTAGAGGSNGASAAAAAMAVTQHCTRSVSVHYEHDSAASSAVCSNSSSSSSSSNSSWDGNDATPAPATATALTAAEALGAGSALLLLPSEHDVANLSWGLSLVGSCSPEMWAQLMELMGRVVEEEEEEEAEKEAEKEADGTRGGGGKGLSDEALARMCQAYLHMRLEHPTATLSTGPVGLLRRGAAVLRQQQQQQQQQQHRCSCGSDGSESSSGRSRPVAVLLTPPSSPSDALPMPTAAPTMMQSPSSSYVSYRSAVSEALSRLGLSHTVQSPTEDGLFHIDLALEVEVRVDTRGRPIRPTTTKNTSPTSTSTTQVIRIAVEVDGPSHFTANTLQPLSPTIYRRRCLENRGWVVVSVPYWLWNQCRTVTGGGATSSGMAEQEEALLLRLMREEGLGEVIEAVTAPPPPPPPPARQQRRRIQKAIKTTAGEQQLQRKPDNGS